MIQAKPEIIVDSIKPDWLRREIAESIYNDKTPTLSMYHGKKKLWEYPVQLEDRRRE